MAIEPDLKDWTWGLERPCPGGGFEAATFTREDVGPMIRENTVLWERVLDRDTDWLRTRPDDATWAPLEYACHVRDVFRIYDERLALMQSEDGTDFPNW